MTNDIHGIIEVDDLGAGYETAASKSSETTSLASSLQEYLIENGRRYHAYFGPDRNLMPTDEVEQQRLDVHHEIFMLIANGDIYKAPVKNPKRVLDLGTGTGIWATDFANNHPKAEVIGMDLSPIQPNWVPENCRFEVDDFELAWTYEKGSFDFIHARNICWSVKNWSDVLSQVMSHLKPGAWFELGELNCVLFSDDNTLPSNWPPNITFKKGVEGFTKLDRIIPTAEWMKKLLLDAGFIDVQVKTCKQPMGPWAKNKQLKQAGELYTMASETTYHAYGMSLFTRVLGMTSEEADACCKAAHGAHLDKRSGVHAYNHFYMGYGRKPVSA